MVAVGKNGFYGVFQLDRLLRVVADTDRQSKLKSRRAEAGSPSHKCVSRSNVHDPHVASACTKLHGLLWIENSSRGKVSCCWNVPIVRIVDLIETNINIPWQSVRACPLSDVQE